MVADSAKRRPDKVTSLAIAAQHLTQNGDRVAMGLCLEPLISFAAGYELIRQNEPHADWTNLRHPL